MNHLLDIAIDTLSVITNQSTGLLHPLDDSATKEMFRALHQEGIPLGYNEIKQLTLSKGWEIKHACSIAEIAERIGSGGQVRIRFPGQIDNNTIIRLKQEARSRTSQQGIPIYSRDFLFNAAKRFRDALIKAQKVDEFLFGLLDDFPKDCCEFSSYLLAEYLMEECDVQQVDKVRGELVRRPYNYHVWLVISGFLVDITADQFRTTNMPVIVTDDRNGWHKRYREVERCRLSQPVFEEFGEPQKTEIFTDYQRIKTFL